MKRRYGLLLGVIVALAVAIFAARPTSHAPSPGPGLPGAPAAGAPSASTVLAGARSAIGFRSPDLAAEHFQRHGSEFGARDVEAYVGLATALRDRPAGGDVLELRRADGTLTRFDLASGAFLAFDPDLTIRTFFKPRDGENYFRRQALRDHR